VGEHLLLKWGTLKGWDVGKNASALAAVERYHEGPVSWGAAQQRDSDAQKQAICDLIDAIDGPITNDWSGEKMTKDEAKACVMGYER